MFFMGRIRWAVRKILLPIKRNDLVLDVGSGGNPYTRSDILLDRFQNSEHRGGVALVIDRVTILGDANKMPFKDKSIDFIIASHILEHMEDPAVFLNELQRVGKAGYIETPNFLCERFVPCEAHTLELANINNKIIIHKKNGPVHDPFISSLEFLNNNNKWRKLFFWRPELFHMRYLWKDKIDFEIVNPDFFPAKTIMLTNKVDDEKAYTDNIFKNNISWRTLFNYIFYHFHKFQRTARLKKINLIDILECPKCKGDLREGQKVLVCKQCNYEYKNDLYIDFDS
ncbi:methyltransferase domain-containing protein [Halobacteriovorax sp. RZ-3]|uniref:methyltransferase domain-containing protein n=1 Tax=Halobacteriovorax sp. RZ-3 TaxID=3157720 RepID=UPI003723BD79